MNSSLISLRQEEVYNYIARSNVVTIQEISDALNISSSTIRRDIKALEDDSRITSFHGGVSANTGYGSFAERTAKNLEEKRAIGATAASLVENGEVLYIGGGSSTFEFAAVLSKRIDLNAVTVVCSAMNIARCFVNNKRFRVIVPGGEFRAEDESMTSQMTVDVLQNYNFTKAFVGSQAINAKNGYTIPQYNLSQVKQVVAQQAKEMILLCDHTKIGKVNAYRICSIDKVDVLITDTYEHNEEELREIERCGTRIIRV